MKRIEIYNEIVKCFEHDFSWLGKQVAEEFLLSAASWNIQTYSNPPFRVRRHLLLFWKPGWLKSCLLERFHTLLGPELCTMMSDITNAALRGTVEAGRFISPFTLKRPFSICTEFGQIIGSADSTELIQKLLNVLEEGIVLVSLGKIGQLSAVQRDEIQEEYGITFIDQNTFTYRTNWVLFAGTYNRKFLVDNAFESRFRLITPDYRLDSKLTKYVINTPQEGVPEDLAIEFRRAIMDKHSVESHMKLPDEIYEIFEDIDPRSCGQLLSYKLCRAWWGIKTTDEEIIELAKKLKAQSDELWRTADDKVFDALMEGPKTLKQLVEETGLSRRQVYYSLKNIKATKIYNIDSKTKKGIFKWRLEAE